ncbi:unnamed protein product, partial [Rotaria sp. Silwood2]
MPFIYRISSGGMLSIPILRQALHVVVMKYESLRTSLIFDTEKDMLMQQIHESCDDNNQLFTFLESYFETEEELNNIIYDERSCPTYFDLSCGLVFRCHVVHKRKFVPNDQLHEGDAIIFNFHHAVFDVPSMNIFLNNLSKSYLNEEPLSDDSNCLRYIDYAVAEREMLMTAASSFWLQTVHDCDIDRPVSLPFDQHHTADEHRTGRTLMIGGSLVLLHPQGNLDLEYFSLTLFRHNVTYFAGVPSFISFLCDYLEKVQQLGRLARIKVLTFGGEAIVSKAFGKIVSHLDLSTVTFYNLYGPAECTIGCIYYQFKPNEVEQGRIPIGTLFPNMRAQILDEFHQFVIPGMSGELFLDGTQRFRGYFGRNDLTDQAFYETFYRTGDVVQMDIKGRIHYIGRKDHQIKLRGQRIELGEIEHCLLEASSHITRCVVVKWSDDHLVAYVQGFDVDEEQLRKHCHSRLPAFMVPSAFI